MMVTQLIEESGKLNQNLTELTNLLTEVNKPKCLRASVSEIKINTHIGIHLWRFVSTGWQAPATHMRRANEIAKERERTVANR